MKRCSTSEEVLDLDDRFGFAHSMLALAYVSKHMPERAVEESAQARALAVAGPISSRFMDSPLGGRAAGGSTRHSRRDRAADESTNTATLSDGGRSYRSGGLG